MCSTLVHTLDLVILKINQVMQDGRIAESGKYDELVISGMHFMELVDAHEASMVLVEAESKKNGNTSIEQPKSALIHSTDHVNENGLDKAQENSKSSRSAKLIKEEERETGRVSFNVYKVYCTEAYGWWGVIVVLLVGISWQGAQMGSDYWLAYETSAKRITSFNPSLFIWIYAGFAFVSLIFIIVRVILVTVMGLKTSQIFFSQILKSILHAPMSFFDTTPSGRILSRVRFWTFLG